MIVVAIVGVHNLSEKCQGFLWFSMCLFTCLRSLKVSAPFANSQGHGVVMGCKWGREWLGRDPLYKSSSGGSDWGWAGQEQALDSFLLFQLYPLHFVCHYKWLLICFCLQNVFKTLGLNESCLRGVFRNFPALLFY